MGGPASSTTAEIYMQGYERTATTTALHPPKIWERFFDGFIPSLNVRISKTFSTISTIFTKILSLLWRKKLIENQRFLTLY